VLGLAVPFSSWRSASCEERERYCNTTLDLGAEASTTWRYFKLTSAINGISKSAKRFRLKVGYLVDEKKKETKKKTRGILSDRLCPVNSVC
jgi:hypothetical protein